jgi:hypothetical protein
MKNLIMGKTAEMYTKYLNGITCFGDIGVGGKIILKRILKNWR